MMFLTFSKLLILVAMHRCQFTDAADSDKENEVESILKRMESDVLAFRDEIERVYSARCETQTLTDCAYNNFNDCSSTFPNQQCLKADELIISACGDGITCNGEFRAKTSRCAIILHVTILTQRLPMTTSSLNFYNSLVG